MQKNEKDVKRKLLENAVKQIEKQHGKGAVMRLGDVSKIKFPVVHTGSIGLDLALGVGGYPRGRVTEIFGPEASGKTTLALQAIAEVQRNGGIAVFIDAEHAMDPVYASKLGVKLEDLLVSQPDTGEQALDIAEALVRSGAIDILVIDSVAALVPRAEIEGEMGDMQVGLQARLMAKAMRKLIAVISKSNTCAIFINQLRHKIGGFSFGGAAETTPGGLALKFHATVRLDIRRIATLKAGDTPVGNRVRVRVVKNKLAPPFRTAEFDIIYGKGISKEGELIDYGLKFGLVTKSGSWYSYGKTQLGQGRENARRFLEEHPEIARELESKVREHLGMSPLILTASEENPEEE
ncbi:MAG: recombinase RecA [Candidatus Hydrothermota bacterium]|nr:MAG: recombinase RecA [Candidatus Hydrothermae bacterium]